MTQLNSNPSQPINSNSLPGKPVLVHLVINNKSITAPSIAVHSERYCDHDFPRNTAQGILPYKKEKNHYYFEILNQCAIKYISIMVTNKDCTSKEPTYLLENYHFEPGDNVLISLDSLPGTDDYLLNFSGHGSAKYQCVCECDDVLMLNPPQKGSIYTERGNYNPYNQFIINRDILLGIVNKFEPEISEESYNLLSIDILSKQARMLIEDFHYCIAMALDNNNMQVYERISADYLEKANVNTDIPGSDSLKYFSREYAQLMVKKIVFDYLDQYQQINYSEVYKEIMKITNADLRDKMIVTFFILYRYMVDFQVDQNSLLNHALNHIQNTDCLKRLNFHATNW